MSQTTQTVDEKTRVVSPQAMVATPVDFTSVATAAVLAAKGRLFGVIVTTALTGNVTVYDNPSAASGTIVGYVASTTAVGTLVPFLDGGVPVATGAYFSASATGGKLTAFVA